MLKPLAIRVNKKGPLLVLSAEQEQELYVLLKSRHSQRLRVRAGTPFGPLSAVIMPHMYRHGFRADQRRGEQPEAIGFLKALPTTLLHRMSASGSLQSILTGLSRLRHSLPYAAFCRTMVAKKSTKKAKK